MKKFNLTTMVLQVNLFSFDFWKNLKTPKIRFKINWPLAMPSVCYGWLMREEKITFRGFWANKWARVAQTLATVGLIKWRSMAVEGHSCVASIPFNAFKNLAWQNFTQIAFTKFRTFWIIVFVQLKIEVKSCQFAIENNGVKFFLMGILYMHFSMVI